MQQTTNGFKLRSDSKTRGHHKMSPQGSQIFTKAATAASSALILFVSFSTIKLKLSTFFASAATEKVERFGRVFGLAMDRHRLRKR